MEKSAVFYLTAYRYRPAGREVNFCLLYTSAAVFVNFKKKPTKEEIIDRWNNFSGEPQKLNLPIAPKQFIRYMEEDNRPQVHLDRDYEHGMGISLGRLREDTAFDYKFVGLRCV